MSRRAPRRDASQRVAARQDRTTRAIVTRAHHAIDRVHALAELEVLRDQASFISDVIKAPLLGHIALVVFIPPTSTYWAGATPTVRRISWHLDPRAAYLAAEAAAEASGGDHRARIDELEQLIKES